MQQLRQGSSLLLKQCNTVTPASTASFVSQVKIEIVCGLVLSNIKNNNFRNYLVTSHDVINKESFFAVYRHIHDEVHRKFSSAFQKVEMG